METEHLRFAKKQKNKETEIVRKAMQQNFKELSEKKIEQAVRETVLAPDNRKIDINGKPISASDLRYRLAQTIDNFGSRDNPEQQLQSSDLSMLLAHSIETINSETSSSQEYFRWLEDASNILKHMNDGYVSIMDLKERNDFLDMSDQRETELLVCLSLYANSRHPKAAEQAHAIQYKLTKLREMRSAIQQNTQNKSDIQTSIEDYYAALPKYKALKTLSKQPFGYDLSDDEKDLLGLFENDSDTKDAAQMQNILINTILDEMKYETEGSAEIDISRLGQLFEKQINNPENNEKHKKRLQHISEKLKELSGRKHTFSVNFVALENHRREMRR